MKRAEADVLAAAPSQSGILGRDIDDIGGLPNLVDDLHGVF
jgi:hypothetical protein